MGVYDVREGCDGRKGTGEGEQTMNPSRPASNRSTATPLPFGCSTAAVAYVSIIYAQKALGRPTTRERIFHD